MRRQRRRAPARRGQAASPQRSSTRAPFSLAHTRPPYSVWTSVRPRARRRDGPCAIARRDSWQRATLETKKSRQRLQAPLAENCRPEAAETAETIAPRVGHGNLGLILTPGNHVNLRGLPGGGRSPSKPVSTHPGVGSGRGNFPWYQLIYQGTRRVRAVCSISASPQLSDRSHESQPTTREFPKRRIREYQGMVGNISR